MAAFTRTPVTGGGGGSRGGGAYLGREWEHPADSLLERTRRKYAGHYKSAQADAEKALDAHLRKNAPKQSSLDGLTDAQHTAFLLALFAGLKWRKTRRAVARILYEADRAATDTVNDAAPEAFAEGANRTLYRFATAPVTGGGGQSRGGGTGFGGHGAPATGGGGGTRGWGARRNGHDANYQPPQPYTPGVVLALIDAGLIAAIRRELERYRDMAWIEQRLQAIAQAEALAHAKIKDMAAAIARRLTISISGAMDTAAQATLYGAWDAGMYEAGEDAVRAGWDVEKTWLGIPDSRIRDSHRHLHNTTLPLHELFHGFAGDLRYPHDPRAPAAEIMRCRCRLAVHPAGQAPKAFDGLLLPSETAAYQRWRDEAIREAGGAFKLYQAHRDGRR